MAYYAWAPIDYGAQKDENGVITGRERVGLGETVDAGTLGIEDAEFRYLVNAGAVREQKYPEEIDVNSGNLEAPNVVLARKARQVLEGTGQAELPVIPA